MNERSVVSHKKGFIARTMCVYCEMVLWNSFIKPGLHIRASGELNSVANDECSNYMHTLSLALSFVALALKAIFWHEAEWFSTHVKMVHSHSDSNLLMFVQVRGKIQAQMCKWGIKTTICGELREEGCDCEECHRTPHYIITIIGTADWVLTHVDIPYILFHSLLIQNFNSTWVKPSWFTEMSQVLLITPFLRAHINVFVFSTFFFIDEAWFHFGGYVNMQNYYVWSLENPHIFWTTLLHPQKIGIWCTADVYWDQSFSRQ